LGSETGPHTDRAPPNSEPGNQFLLFFKRLPFLSFLTGDIVGENLNCDNLVNHLSRQCKDEDDSVGSDWARHMHWHVHAVLQLSTSIPVRVLWAFFTQASSVQDVAVSYQLRVRRRVCVQPHRRSFLPLFNSLYRGRHLSFDYHYHIRSSYIFSRPCAFVKSVALSSALALPSPLVRINFVALPPLPYVASYRTSRHGPESRSRGSRGQHRGGLRKPRTRTLEGQQLPSMRVHRDGLLREIWPPR